MNSKDFVLQLVSLVLGSVVSGSVIAQNVPPIPVELGSTQQGLLDDDAPRRPTNHAFACYALNTKPGEEVSIRLNSSAFDPVLEVARGALCNAASLQLENDNADQTTKDAQLTFRAAGGRYLILVRGASPTARGAFQLKLASDIETTEAPSVAESDEARRRQEIMAMEIEKRNAAIAAAEARRQAEIAAAEARHAAALAQQQEEPPQRASRYDDDDDYAQPPARNFAEIFASTLVSELDAKERQQEAFQRDLNQAVRRGEAEYERRMAAERTQEAYEQQEQALHQAAAQQARAAEAQRLAEERARAASEASRRATLAQQNLVARTSDPVRAEPPGGRQVSLTETPEAIIVCTRPDEKGRFKCDTPVDVNYRGGPNAGDLWRTPEDFVSRTDSCSTTRRLQSATHLVWGCGYGATNGGNTMDRSAGVDVKGRNTYFCAVREWPCRRTTPQ